MKFECKTAIFEFEECDKDLIESMSNYLDLHADKVHDFFEITPKNKAKIRIIPTKQKYDEDYRKSRGLGDDFVIYDWMIGNCNYAGVITYVSLHDYKNTSHSFKPEDYDKALTYYNKTILHEYVHYVNLTFDKIHDCNHTEKYLVEGIASYLSGQKDNLHLSLNATKEQILNREKFYYNDYYLLTKYFVENYDKDYILQVFQSSRQARELLENELYDKTQEYFNNDEQNK